MKNSDAQRERDQHRHDLIMNYWQNLNQLANYDQLLELRDLIEAEISLRITKAEWDFYSDLPSPEHYKFYAEEEQARNEL